MRRAGNWVLGVSVAAAGLGCAAALWLAGMWIWAIYVPIHVGYGLVQYTRLRSREPGPSPWTPADYLMGVLISSLVVLVALALRIYAYSQAP